MKLCCIKLEWKRFGNNMYEYVRICLVTFLLRFSKISDC